MRRYGYTLIEILVVMSLTLIFVSITATYSNSGRNQINLFASKAAVLQTINRAKSMSISTYNEPNPPCMFGFKFDPMDDKKYYLVRIDSTGGCSGANIFSNGGIYSETVVGSYFLPDGLEFAPSGQNISAIAFIPPVPRLEVWDSTISTSTEGKIKISSSDGASSTLIINTSGLISY